MAVRSSGSLSTGRPRRWNNSLKAAPPNGDRHDHQHPVLRDDRQPEEIRHGEPQVHADHQRDRLGRVDVRRPAAVAQAEGIQPRRQGAGKAADDKSGQGHRHDATAGSAIGAPLYGT